MHDIENTCGKFLSSLPKIDWNDFEKSSLIAASVCNEIANDKYLLRSLIMRTASDPELFNMCECHDLDDKIVLHNDLSNGYRIRLRLANDEQYERAHNHRFPFTTYILYGKYYHKWYQTDKELSDNLKPEDVKTVCTRIENTGSLFTISANALHSTTTSPKAVSLMICGNPIRDRSFIININDGLVWGKSGKKHETEAQILSAKMPKQVFDSWVTHLEDVNLI